MALIELDAEALADGHDDLSQQGGPVGIEQPVQRPPDAIVIEVLHLIRAKPKKPRAEAVYRLLLTIDGLALDDDGAQQHPQGLGVGHGTAPIERGHVSVEKLLQAAAFEEVVDQG